MQEELDRHGYLTFAKPTNVSKAVAIHVKVPFMLPKCSYSWHYQKYPAWSGCTLRRLTEVERDHERQQGIYRSQVRRLLEPLKRLYALNSSSLEVELLADEDTKARVACDCHLFEDLDKYRRYPGALMGIALGRLLNIYTQTLGDKASISMMNTSHEWAFNTKTVKVAWDFGLGLTTSPTQGLQRYSCGHFFISNGGVTSRAFCTPDLLKGTAQFDFDMVKAVRREIKDLKETIRKVRAREPGNTLWNISEEETKLARQETKLRKLGVLEVEPVAEQTGPTR